MTADLRVTAAREFLAAIREAMARGAAETPPAPGRKSHAARVAAQGATHPQGEAA